MNTFKLHTLDSAPPKSAPTLETVAKNFGMIPNIFAVLAESPSAVKAYLQLGELLEQSGFTPEEQQVISLAISVENKCSYCVAAHSFLARNIVHVAPGNIEALRRGGVLPDAKLNALATFTHLVVRERGWVAESQELREFLAAGYTNQHLLEVVMAVSMKTLSNYVNHLTETPLDGPFASETWDCPSRCKCQGHAQCNN